MTGLVVCCGRRCYGVVKTKTRASGTWKVLHRALLSGKQDNSTSTSKRTRNRKIHRLLYQFLVFLPNYTKTIQTIIVTGSMYDV